MFRRRRQRREFREAIDEEVQRVAPGIEADALRSNADIESTELEVSALPGSAARCPNCRSRMRMQRIKDGRNWWTLGGVFVIEERFFRWDEGRRSSFVVERASLPGYRRLGDDYLVEPVSAGSSRFTWTIAAEHHPLARLGAPFNAAIANRMFKDTGRHFGTL